MLINMHVKNLALIEEADVDFGDNLNILTGETGAGKSILIGSIQSALGGKVPKDMIREGTESALISLLFQTDNAQVLKKLDEYGIPCEDGEIVITRRISKGRVVNKINDTTVTAGRLKEISPLLLDLSGQHENQLLLSPVNHRRIIDSYGRQTIGPALENVAEAYRSFQEVKKELAAKDMGEEDRIREIEFIQYEIREIEEAALKEGEDEELEEEYYLISHSKEILEDAGTIHELTSDGRENAADLIGQAVRHMNSIISLDQKAGDLFDQLSTIDALVNDFNRDLSAYIGSLDFDPGAFKQIEDRLNQINHLKSKYGDSIQAIKAYYDRSINRLDELLHYEEVIEKLKNAYKKSEDALLEACEKLSALRRQTAGPLIRSIVSALKDLNFLEVAFDVRFDRSSAISPEGYDELCFMISTNPGQPMRPLHEIASGGELSRIMLAVKSILADEEGIETLIFDEIDTGISGRTAQKVSEKLSHIAGNRQVIAITHLPQIAAMADSHYLIEKTSDQTGTISKIYALDEDQSVIELARMLSGAKVTDAVIENAREMRRLAKEG